MRSEAPALLPILRSRHLAEVLTLLLLHPDTDGYGRVHGLDNVYVADGSVFVTSGAHNPTNTIMAVALRNMRHLAGTPS